MLLKMQKYVGNNLHLTDIVSKLQNVTKILSKVSRDKKNIILVV